MLVDVQPLLNPEGHCQYKFGKWGEGDGEFNCFQLTAQFVIQQFSGVLFFFGDHQLNLH